MLSSLLSAGPLPAPEGNFRMAISSTVNVHDVKVIRAHSHRSLGAPLSLHVPDSGGGVGYTEITFFTDDQNYTDALIAAINKVNADREAALVKISEDANSFDVDAEIARCEREIDEIEAA